MILPLSKCYDPADYADLAEELAIVDKVGIDGQHDSRRWEYAMALRAAQVHREVGAISRAYDVGGAGSPFFQMVKRAHLPLLETILLVDPALDNEMIAAGHSAKLLDYFVWHGNPPLADAVFCLSVLEHVDDLDSFCYHLSCLVAPGGLLVLTFDYTPTDLTCGWPIDVCHWHWMRKRIFNEWARGSLHARFCPSFDNLGDIGGRGTAVLENWGYAPASLALVKRR